MTTGDNQADRDAGGDPMEMRQGPNYDLSAPADGVSGELGATESQGGWDRPRARSGSSSSRLLPKILGALLIATAIIELLLFILLYILR